LFSHIAKCKLHGLNSSNASWLFGLDFMHAHFSQKPKFCRIQYLCIPYFMKACGARIKILNEIFTHFQFILSSKLQTIMLICAALLKHNGLRRDEETLQPSVYLNKYVSFFLTTHYCFIQFDCESLFHVLVHTSTLTDCFHSWDPITLH
jgi:hypothetical protein